MIVGAFGIYVVELSAEHPPYAIAPGEFHGGIDWRGTISDAEWKNIRESVFDSFDSASAQ